MVILGFKLFILFDNIFFISDWECSLKNADLEMKESANRIAKPYVKMNICKEEGLVQIEHISILRGEPAIFFPWWMQSCEHLFPQMIE